MGDGLSVPNSHKYPAADEILFDRYISEKTGNCAKPLGDGRLRYQQEYILCGKESDRENLEGTAARLILIREASNCGYLFSDEEKMEALMVSDRDGYHMDKVDCQVSHGILTLPMPGNGAVILRAVPKD